MMSFVTQVSSVRGMAAERDVRAWHESRCNETMLATRRLLPALWLAFAAGAACADPGNIAGRYDANHDGYVSYGEWVGMGGEPSAFKASDANHDGRLSGEEIEKAQARDARVKAAEASGDAWVSARVTAALLMDEALTISDMQVATKDGRVRLTGSVRSEDDAQAAERIAWRVEGVHAVDNALLVRPPFSARSR
jgi:BON domain/EF hand